MKIYAVVRFSMGSDLKALVVERFIHTLNTRMGRYFTAKNTRQYIDALQDLGKS